MENRITPDNTFSPQKMNLQPETEVSQISSRALKNKRWIEIVKQAGTRYSDCRIENFQLDGDREIAQRQRAVLEPLARYTGDIPSVMQSGMGLLLYGPCGTGKDHLMIGAIHKAIDAGIDVLYVYGVQLLNEISSTIGENAKSDLRDIVRKYVQPEILAISDIRPPSGNLSGFHKDCLYQIATQRYKNRKPTWMTVNARNKEQVDTSLSPQVVSRFAHAALTLNCEWPDWRLKKWAT